MLKRYKIVFCSRFISRRQDRRTLNARYRRKMDRRLILCIAGSSLVLLALGEYQISLGKCECKISEKYQTGPFCNFIITPQKSNEIMLHHSNDKFLVKYSFKVGKVRLLDFKVRLSSLLTRSFL